MLGEMSRSPTTSRTSPWSPIAPSRSKESSRPLSSRDAATALTKFPAIGVGPDFSRRPADVDFVQAHARQLSEELQGIFQQEYEDICDSLRERLTDVDHRVDQQKKRYQDLEQRMKEGDEKKEIHDLSQISDEANDTIMPECSRCPQLRVQVQQEEERAATLREQLAREEKKAALVEAEKMQRHRECFSADMEISNLQLRLAYGRLRQQALREDLQDAYEKVSRMKDERLEREELSFVNQAHVQYLQDLHSTNCKEEEEFQSTGVTSHDSKQCDALVAAAHKKDTVVRLLTMVHQHFKERIEVSTKAMHSLADIREYLEAALPAWQNAASKKDGGHSVPSATINHKHIQDAVAFAEKKFRLHVRTASELIQTSKRVQSMSRHPSLAKSTGSFAGSAAGSDIDPDSLAPLGGLAHAMEAQAVWDAAMTNK